MSQAILCINTPADTGGAEISLQALMRSLDPCARPEAYMERELLRTPSSGGTLLHQVPPPDLQSDAPTIEHAFGVLSARSWAKGLGVEQHGQCMLALYKRYRGDRNSTS